MRPAFDDGLLDNPKKSRGFNLEKGARVVHLGPYMYHFV